MKFRNFEEMICWQRARWLTVRIYRASESGSFSRDFKLSDQIRSASISITSNIAEGSERDGNREFIHFLSIAKGSAAEVRSQACLACDLGYLTADAFEEIHLETTRIGQMIGALIQHLRSSPLKGRKFLRFKAGEKPD